MPNEVIADDLLAVIAEIQHRKRERRIVPDHALRVSEIFKEMKNYTAGEIDGALRELVNEGKIKAGRTATDTWIKFSSKTN